MKYYLQLVCLLSAVVRGEAQKINILILGGNGMLGSATVESLLRQDRPYNITILNRGNSYWDTETTVLPYVNHIQCARGDGFRDDCTQLTQDKTFYDVVVDFSAYDPLDIEDILIVLKGRFKRYIYLSSDSVYEVCEFKLHDGFAKEDDAIRPHDPIIREEYNSWDNYGHKKLTGEETLAKYHKLLNYDYIALRLPDVLGPRDNTKRFWKYYMWTKLNAIVGPVHIKKELVDKPLRFVYSADVGRQIAKLALPNTYPDTVWNQVYNLGFKETITFKDFIKALGNYIDRDAIHFYEGDDATLNFGFPSVTRGPTDISKAERVLNWKSTEMITALNTTCKFYEDAQYNPEYKYLLDIVLDVLDVRGEKYRDFIELHYDKTSLKEEL